MRKIIFHYHLFKNAGTSIDALLKTNFAHQWLSAEFNHAYALNQQQVSQWLLQNPQAVAFSSHTALLPPPQLSGVEIFPILFIRHPIDRIASAYHFEKKQKSDKSNAILAKNTSFKGYIDANLARSKFGQCRNFQSNRLAQYFHGLEGNHTDLALQALDALPFIGLVEEFEQSIHRLNQWLIPHFPNFRAKVIAENVSRETQSLEQKLAAIAAEIGEDYYQQLLDANAADMAVYQTVKNRYANNVLIQSPQIHYSANPTLINNEPLIQDTKLVLIGSPCSGSKSVAQYLTHTGLQIGHNTIAEDGICSWRLNSRHKPALNSFAHASNLLRPEILCHFVRNPLEAIAAIVIENEFNQRVNNSFNYRRDVIKRRFAIDLADYEPLTAATLSYIYWNKLAEKANPDLTIRIEKMNSDLLPVIRYYNLKQIDTIPKINTSAIEFETDINKLLDLVQGKARLYLEHYWRLFYADNE
jgi:hypothetical protein